MCIKVDGPWTCRATAADEVTYFWISLSWTRYKCVWSHKFIIIKIHWAVRPIAVII